MMAIFLNSYFLKGTAIAINRPGAGTRSYATGYNSV
jgi:hypothetical protein